MSRFGTDLVFFGFSFLTVVCPEVAPDAPMLSRLFSENSTDGFGYSTTSCFFFFCAVLGFHCDDVVVFDFYTATFLILGILGILRNTS